MLRSKIGTQQLKRNEPPFACRDRQIIRAFTRLREILASNVEMRRKIEKMDKQIQSIYKLLGRLLTEEEKPKGSMGFRKE